MEIRNSRTCEKCGNSSPLNKVKLFPKDKESNWLVCEECCEKLKIAAEKLKTGIEGHRNIPMLKREPIRNVVKAKEEIKAKPIQVEKKEDLDLQVVFCSRCKYKFKINVQRADICFRVFCPFCGKDDRLIK